MKHIDAEHSACETDCDIRPMNLSIERARVLWDCHAGCALWDCGVKEATGLALIRAGNELEIARARKLARRLGVRG